MATKWGLKVEVDCPEPRLNKGRLVMGAYGLTWDKAFSDTTCFWDSPTQSLMPLPLPLSGAWETNFSGLYARLSLTDLVVTGGSWRQYQVKGAGDYWIGLDDNLTYASNIYTATSYPANSAWYFGVCNSDTTSNSNRVIMTITFGYVAATPDTVGIKLRFFANGGCQIFKNGVLKGQYDQSDSNQTAGRNTPGTQKMTGQYHGVYVLPHKRRELLVMTSWGLNFSHTFEDLDQNSTTNTILPAGYIRTFIEQKRPFFQMAPIRFSASCSAYSKPIQLRYAPPTGATFNWTVWYDRISQATGGAGGTISIVKSDGSAYTPDGVIDTIRVKVTLTSSDQIEAFGVSLAEAWYQPTPTTTANAPVDITPYLQNLSLAVDESGRTTLHMSGRRKRLTDAGVQQVQITGDRPVRVALSDGAVTPTWSDIFRGTLQPPQIQYARADNTTDADMSALVFTGQDRSHDFTLQMFDSAVIYDGFTMESAVKDLVTCCGYATTDVVWNDTSGFTLPRSSDLAKGHANVCPQRGDNVNGMLTKIKTDYAANWFTAWQPTATGYKYVWSNPSSLSTTPVITLYHSTADAKAQGVVAGLVSKRVIRKFSAHYESPEANQIVVVGQDPRDASLIYAFGADSASMDPTTAPASRPYNWRGRPVMYINSDPAITTPAAAAQAQTVLASRLMSGRILIEFESDVLVDDTTNRPLWIGDVIKLMKPGGTVVRGVYRIVSIPSMNFERETSTIIVRRAQYRCVYIGAG